MRFMIIVKATPDSEAGVMPPDTLLAEMADYHEQLAKAGVLLDGSGLQPSAKGWRIRYNGKKPDERTLIDGPFAESKELIAGYTLIQVRTRARRRWSGRRASPTPRSMASKPRLKCANCLSWKILAPAKPWSVFATSAWVRLPKFPIPFNIETRSRDHV